MRTQIRIVAGSLRGRKLTCTVNPDLRPTPQMVREALFSILGNAVPERPFYDVFAGTGIIGIEAISRGASLAGFVERDFRLLDELERHLRAFKVGDAARIIRGDVYRWAERWRPPAEAVNVFLSPPFADLERRQEEMLALVGGLQSRLFPGSVLVLQAEQSPLLEQLPDLANWDERRYGRNRLLFWVAEAKSPLTPDPSPQRGEGSKNPLTTDPSPLVGEGSQNPLTPDPSPQRGEGSKREDPSAQQGEGSKREDPSPQDRGRPTGYGDRGEGSQDSEP